MSAMVYPVFTSIYFRSLLYSLSKLIKLEASSSPDTNYTQYEEEEDDEYSELDQPEFSQAVLSAIDGFDPVYYYSCTSCNCTYTQNQFRYRWKLNLLVLYNYKIKKGKYYTSF